MITHLARIDVMIKDKFKPNVFSDERLLHGEGPIWDEKRKLIWVADVHGYRILGFDIDGNIIEDHKLNHKPASFFFSDKYMYVVCMDGIYQFIDESLVLVAGANLGNTGDLNDGKVGPDGRFYVGQAHPDFKGRFFCLDNDYTLKALFDGQKISNGLDWNLDETILYHTDSRKFCIDAYDFDCDHGEVRYRGIVINTQNNGFAGVPDGFAIDQEGCLWVAMCKGGKIVRINPEQGKIIESIDIPVSMPTSCAFVGEELDVLIITSASSVVDCKVETEAGFTFAIKPGVKGRKPYVFKR